MFTQSVGLEQSNNGNPVEIIAVEPGMVELRCNKRLEVNPKMSLQWLNTLKMLLSKVN